ncbi:MAG: hypothetical protein HY944_05510 [Gemmatimonadetes bacterium]|nr:hypothetical protein [Gemmatimonadota bacterium]
MNAVEHGTLIQLRSAGRIVPLKTELKLRDVAPQPVATHGDLLGTARFDDVFAKVVAQAKECGSEGAPRTFLVEFGPEERRYLVAAMKAGRPSGSEVREERDTLGTTERLIEGASVRRSQVQSTQNAKLDHLTHPE